VQAERFADRLRSEAGPSRAEQARRGLSLATSRKPDTGEVERAVAFMNELEENGTPSDQVLDRFALLVLNLNEFIYLD